MPYRTNTRLDAVICFDEARGLMSTDGQLQVKTSTMFRSMRRALKDFYEKTDKKIFCLTMDTVSRVSSFAPPNTNDESLRTFEEFEGTTLELFPPIYCIDSMDLIPFSRVVDHKNTESYIAYKLMAFNNTFIFNTIQQMISIIKQHKNMFSTWNNSVVLKWVEIEPLLAFSSAKLMQHENNRLLMVKVLHRYLMEGTIHVGDIGEIVASLILLFTFDKSQTRDYPSPLNLAEFIVLLFGEELCNQISKTSKLPERGSAYQRGAAFMPELNFPGCDIIVPICLPDAKNPKSRPIMTFIQVKNRKGDKLTAGLRKEARFSCDSTAEQWETNDKLSLPLIFTMMSLRCQRGGRDPIEQK
ncbi:hypothetical protein V8E54_011553 [Elaphomyces granulatus]